MFIKMDLVVNNLPWLINHKTQTNKQTIINELDSNWGFNISALVLNKLSSIYEASVYERS